ncbi:WcaF family extracellular polysaccharide biosynthesis acetyltransferase [Pedobacter sp. AW31-3R]|uniref:WcaF family extracellular polysaccharide biosynthesis acetyltransferase n=1 Tax=Pedobacter sp. AW31-3R TaxID=3445781 RepID=UPI003F9F1D4C
MEATEHLQTDLSAFKTGDYKNAPLLKRSLWYTCSCIFFHNAIPWPYALKLGLLRMFGTKGGKGLVIKTNVRIKNPWRLTLGNHCWIGESVWIDNLEDVHIGHHVCLSQAALLLTGNHDYTRTDFPYRLGKITLEDGVWIGARSVVCPGVTCKSHSVLTVNAVAVKDLESWKIYGGNPALFIRNRKIHS